MKVLKLLFVYICAQRLPRDVLYQSGQFCTFPSKMLLTSAHINDPMKIWITDWGLVCLIWACNVLLNLLSLSSAHRSLKYIYAFLELWEANCLKGYIYTLVFPQKHIHPRANFPYVHTCPKSPEVCLVLSDVIIIFVLISVCMKKCKSYIKLLLG